ncbi:MAG: hypothetical protein ABIJ35_07840 [Acidobacteriota bacterium]
MKWFISGMVSAILILAVFIGIWEINQTRRENTIKAEAYQAAYEANMRVNRLAHERNKLWREIDRLKRKIERMKQGE